MLETELSPVYEALKAAFGEVYPLFSRANIYEHRAAPLCFAGLTSYTLEGDDCAAEFTVELLSARSQTADGLEKDLDEKAVSALEKCAAESFKIKRLATKFSREQSGYIASAALIISPPGGEKPEPEPAPEINLSIGGTSYPGFTDFKIQDELKTAETALLSGIIRCRSIGRRPKIITVSGKFPEAEAVYSALSPLIGQNVGTVALGSLQFPEMFLSALTLSGGSETSLAAEFKEVSLQ